MLSDRDSASLASEEGLRQISKSTVSEITKELRARYQAFRARTLGEVELLGLFCDAIYLPTRPSGGKEGVLVDETGQRVLLDVVLGQRERFEDWLEMGRDLVRRGLRAPMLVVTDGAPGLIRAMEELWPTGLRSRRPPRRRTERPGCGDWSPTWSTRTRARPPAWPRTPALCVHLEYPLRLRKRLRSTNLLERSLEEVKRRTKVIGRFPGETSCLGLCWAVLTCSSPALADSASPNWSTGNWRSCAPPRPLRHRAH